MSKEGLKEIAEIMENNVGIGRGNSSLHEHYGADFSGDDADGEYWETFMGGPDDDELARYEESVSIHESEDPTPDDSAVEGGSLRGSVAVSDKKTNNEKLRSQEIIEWLSRSQLARKFKLRDGFFVPKGPQVRLTDGAIVDAVEWLLGEGIRGGIAICGYSIVHTTPESKYGERLSFFRVVIDAPFPRTSENASGTGSGQPEGRVAGAPQSTGARNGLRKVDHGGRRQVASAIFCGKNDR